MTTTKKVTPKELVEFFNKAKNETPSAYAKSILLAANYAGKIIREEVINFHGGKGSKSQLARSFLPAKFIGSPKALRAGALSTLVYADIQDRGGTIKSSRSNGMLAIPLQKGNEKRWPRDWPKDDLTLIKSKKGNLLLVTMSGKKGTIKPQYLLRKSVSITGSGYLKSAARRCVKELPSIVGNDIGISLARMAR